MRSETHTPKQESPGVALASQICLFSSGVRATLQVTEDNPLSLFLFLPLSAPPSPSPALFLSFLLPHPSPCLPPPSSSLSSFLFFLLLPYPPPSSSPLYLFQACCLTVLYIYSRTLSLPVTLSVPLPPHRLLSPFMSFGLVL